MDTTWGFLMKINFWVEIALIIFIFMFAFFGLIITLPTQEDKIEGDFARIEAKIDSISQKINMVYDKIPEFNIIQETSMDLQ